MAFVSPRLQAGVLETPLVFRTKHRGPLQCGPDVLFGAPGGIPPGILPSTLWAVLRAFKIALFRDESVP